MNFPKEDVDAFEFRMHDPVTDEWFYYRESSWEGFEKILISISGHRGHLMELWALSRYDSDPLEPETPWMEDGKLLYPWKRIARVRGSKTEWSPAMNGPSMGGPRLGAVEGWVVTRDGETLKAGFKDENEAFWWLQKYQSQSVDWAVRYGGYDIVLVRENKAEQSYKRDREEKRHAGGLSPEEMAEDFEHAVRMAFVDVYGEPSDSSKVEKAIRSSYLDPGKKQKWTEVSPNVVLVGSEYAWIEDMFSSSEEMARWEQVAELLRHRGWPGAWFDSINAGVHVMYWRPDEKNVPQTGPELGAARVRRVKPTRMPLAKAERLAAVIQGVLEPYAQFIQVVGSIRRQAPVVGDIEFVVLPKNLSEFFDFLEEAGGFTGGERKQVGRVGKDFPVELYIAHEPRELGGLVFMYTGDFKFNIAMRMKAKKRGLKLNQYGIWKGDRAVLQSENERDFFKFLGVRYHEPEERSLAARVKPKSRAKIGGSGWNETWSEEE